MRWVRTGLVEPSRINREGGGGVDEYDESRTRTHDGSGKAFRAQRRIWTTAATTRRASMGKLRGMGQGGGLTFWREEFCIEERYGVTFRRKTQTGFWDWLLMIGYQSRKNEAKVRERES